MNKLILIIALSILTPPSFVMAQSDDADVTVTVDGMTCEACVQTLDKVFTKQESVNNVDVVLEDQTLAIDTVEGQILEDAKIKELVEWGGYDLVSISRSE